MAKGKYEQWIKPEGLLKIEGWARDGLTEEDIAKNMGISRSTLNEWKIKYPDISDTLKKNKEVADRKVENALYQKAIGTKEKVRRAVKVKEVLYDQGKRISETEHIEYVEEEIYIPPDTTAAIFWLKNRKPDVWKDKQSVELTGLAAEQSKLEELLEQRRKRRDNG